MPDPILASKISLPLLRPNLTPRPRLVKRLNAELWQPEGFSRHFTLLSAPAGYGKTTLVVDWLRGVKQPVSWLSLDEHDNDPARFLAYLIAALEEVDPGIGKKLRKLLRTPQLPPEVLLTTLFNELNAIPTPFFLALDDVHILQSQAIYRLLSFLLEHLPPRLHLVILSREDPPLPVGRLRARGEMLEIRQIDLSFTMEETKEFIRRAAGLDLPTEALHLLSERTEGWAVGLQLAALALKENMPEKGGRAVKDFVDSFAGSRRYILDYLFEEVLHKQPQDIEDFLLRTSILDRMCAPLCDSIVGTLERSNIPTVKRSDHILEYLEHSNLFLVALDPQREWYRYHPLFREMLRHRLRLASNISEIALHERASRWLEQNGFLEDAVQHSLFTQDWEPAAALLGKVSSTLLIRGEFGILTGWFQRLPEEILRSQPELCQVYAWALLLTGKLEAAENLLECADALADQNPIILGKNAAAKAYLAQVRGDGRKLIQESERALALLPASFETDRGLVALSLGMAYWHIGKLKEAESVLEEARRIALKTSNDYAAATAEIFQARCQAVQGKLQLAEKSYLGILESGPQVSILVIAHLDLGAIYLEWNDLDRAAGHLQQALAIAKLSGNAEFQIAGLILQSLLKFIQGDRSGAFTTLREAKQMDASSHAPLRATQRLNALQVELVLASGEVEEASRLGGDLTEEVDWHPFYRFLGLTRARLMLAQGYTLEAAEYLYSCVKKASEAGWGYGVIAARLLQAMCADTPGTALTFLTEAINLARPERFIRSFIETGEPLIPLLRKAASQGVAPIYIREILKEMEDKPERRSPEDAGLVEPLSEREIEVLRQVTAGLSNREIAEKLVIGLGTVKTHIHHICGKLGVRNRTEAAMKAKELKLV